MSLPPPAAAAEPRQPGGPPPRPDPDPPDAHPPTKRLCLGGAWEAGWRLLPVPRLSEREKEWPPWPRPCRAPLLSPEAIFSNPRRPRGGQSSPRGVNAGPQGPPSPRVHRGARPSRRFSEAGLRGPRAEGAQRPPDPSLRDTHGRANEDGRWCSVRAGSHRPEDNSHRTPTGNRLRGLASDEESKPACHGVENRRQAGRVTRPESKEKSPWASAPNAPGWPPRQPRLCRGSGDSESAPAPAKERAGEGRDRKETRVSASGNICRPPARPAAQRRKVQDGAQMLGAEAPFPRFPEHRVRAQGEEAISSPCGHLGGVRPDVREPEANFTRTLHKADREEAETCLGRHTPTSSGKRPSESYSIRRILRENRENSWVVHSYQSHCETRKKTGGKCWDWLQSSETALLSEDDCYAITAMSAHEEQPKLLMIGTLGSQKALIHFFWFSGKGENGNRLQLPLQYYAAQKDCYLSHVSVNFMAERFHFHEGISAEEAGDSMLAWHEMLRCLKQTDVRNLIIRNMNVNRRNNILSVYLQTGVSKSLHIILKTNTASLLNNFDSLPGTENDSILEEGCIFKWIMCLNYPKNIMAENQIVYLGRTLTVSIPLGDNMKPMLEEKRLFKTEQVFEEFKKKSIDSFSMTTKNIVLMDFDDRDEISYKSKTSPEQVMNVKNWAQCGTNTVKIHVNSLPQFVQNNYEHINENFYEINMHNENVATERKQEHNKISSFNCKCIAEDIVNVRQQAIPASHCTKRTEQTNPMIVTQVQNFGSLLKSEIEAKRHELILMEEEKAIAQSLTYCHQVHKDIKVEKEEKNSFYSMDGIFSVQPVSLMSRKLNVEETKYVNQHNLADKKEYESILQESELANLKHFYPKNDSTECVKHQLEADLSVGNNECFQDLTAKCLPTEVMTIAKDFEMKSKFDLVLEELRMFHKISKEDEILSTVETNNGQENYFRENNAVEAVKTKIKKDLKIGTVNKICESSLLCDAKAGPNRHKRRQSLFNWETVPRNREQEVPNAHSCLRTPEEELLYSTSEEDCEKPSPKRPAFSSDEFKEEKINYIVKGGSNFSHGISRVLPLKTCSRPIRVGLSRKAKLKQLHPYLK